MVCVERDLKDHIILVSGYVFVWDCLHFYSNFFLYQELASFPLLAFFRKEKKKSVWSRHTWLSNLWKAPLLFLPWEQLHFIFSEQATNEISQEAVQRMKSISGCFSLRYQQIDFWDFSIIHMYIYVHAFWNMLGLVIILCKIEPIFSEVVVPDYLQYFST